MAAKPGTLEILSQEIALALAPLEERLQNDGVLELLADLGLSFPPDLLNASGVLPALTALGTAAGELPDLVTGLVEAGCFLGLGALLLGTAALLAGKRALVPLKDPRLAESLGFTSA